MFFRYERKVKSLTLLSETFKLIGVEDKTLLSCLKKHTHALYTNTHVYMHGHTHKHTITPPTHTQTLLLKYEKSLFPAV